MYVNTKVLHCLEVGEVVRSNLRKKKKKKKKLKEVEKSDVVVRIGIEE